PPPAAPDPGVGCDLPGHRGHHRPHHPCTTGTPRGCGHRCGGGTVLPVHPETIQQAPPGRQDSMNVVDCENVSVRYPGAERTAVAGMTTHVRRGQWVNIIGPNGCGKTSLLHALARVL